MNLGHASIWRSADVSSSAVRSSSDFCFGVAEKAFVQFPMSALISKWDSANNRCDPMDFAIGALELMRAENRVCLTVTREPREDRFVRSQISAKWALSWNKLTRWNRVTTKENFRHTFASYIRPVFCFRALILAQISVFFGGLWVADTLLVSQLPQKDWNDYCPKIS